MSLAAASNSPCDQSISIYDPPPTLRVHPRTQSVDCGTRLAGKTFVMRGFVVIPLVRSEYFLASRARVLTTAHMGYRDHDINQTSHRRPHHFCFISRV